MIKKYERGFRLTYMKIIVAGLFTLAIIGFTPTASGAPVMWGKTELKAGQIGKVTLYADVATYNADGSLAKILPEGGEYRVYTSGNAKYGLGGGLYIHMYAALNYETPSKAKLALLNGPKDNRIYWKGMEFKPGQKGILTVTESTMLFYLDTNGIPVRERYLNAGERYRVYGIHLGETNYYNVGEGLYTFTGTSVKYETPSQAFFWSLPKTYQ